MKIIRKINNIKNKIKACCVILSNNRYYLFCAKKNLSSIEDNDVHVLINNPSKSINNAIINFLKEN